jgi:FMN-dependent NADH-azoreductase
MNILRIDSSARRTGSVSRQLTDQLLGRLIVAHPDASVTVRDLAADIPPIGEAFTYGILYDLPNPTPEGKAAAEVSDALVAELLAADTVVLGLPLYNWTVPSLLKTYIDQVTRPGLMFDYIDRVFYGKLKPITVYIVYTAGGTPKGSPKEFATAYTEFWWKTMGAREVVWILADNLMWEPGNLAAAQAQVDALSLNAGVRV